MGLAKVKLETVFLLAPVPLSGQGFFMTKFQVEVTESGFVAGEWHEKGKKLTLTERQKGTGLRRGRVKVLSEGGEEDGPAGGDELELEEVRAKLDKLGVSYRPNAKLDTLKKKLAEAEDSGLE